MSDVPPTAPSADAPPPGAPRRATAPGAGSHVQTVRVTAPDLARRVVLDKARGRLLLALGGFLVLFGLVAGKLAIATVIAPVEPRQAARLPDPATTRHESKTVDATDAIETGGPQVRAMIEDRNGEILAISLRTAALYADPRELVDPTSAAHRLKQLLPRIDEDAIRARLTSEKRFVWIARHITPSQELAINRLGIPGLYFQATERRRYPQGRVAAQVLGGVDVDGHGIAGVERAFDKRLHDDATPLRLSIDGRVQAAMHDELSKSMDEFKAIGACGLVFDVRTGEVIAMVSLPDYDANQAANAPPAERFNRAITGMYEPGSTFKLQTAAMALDDDVVHLWSVFDAAHPIHIGRFTITDFEGKHRMLELPEVIAYSSNLGAAHIAQQVGAERQRSWLQKMGMFNRIGIELPEQGRPIVQSAEQWKEVTTMTVGFGHGIAVSPLHVVRGTAAIANGGILLKPTILADAPNAPVLQGTRVMRTETSDTLRKLMRLVVTDGYGKPADVPGYFVGGKTGTAEKVAGHGYRKHTNVSAFMSVFPMNAPRYAVYFMLDEPKGNKSTGGFSTAGAVAAPGAGRVIARIAPMLGLLPETGAQAAATQVSLSMPLRPGRPAGYRDTPVARLPTPEPEPVSTHPVPRHGRHQREASLEPAADR